MDEIKIKNLSVINNEKGDILKGFLKSENKAIEVNEVYFTEINPSEINETLNQIYKVKIEDFNRNEGDRVLLAGYGDGDEIALSDVNADTNIQQASIGSDANTTMTIYFDLSFAREFDANFALRMADFDKVDI